MARHYQVLHKAIRAWGSAPAAPAGFADRFFGRQGAADRRPTPWVVRFRPAVLTAAVAAPLLLAVFAGGHLGRFHRSEPVPERTINSQALSTALADATSATWDLARATSAPAARIGHEVLEATELTEASLPLPVEVDSASDVPHRVGGRVNAVGRPFSGAARHAFGFLLGSALDETNAPSLSAKGS